MMRKGRITLFGDRVTKGIRLRVDPLYFSDKSAEVIP
jgi:hypothetical protein